MRRMRNLKLGEWISPGKLAPFDSLESCWFSSEHVIYPPFSGSIGANRELQVGDSFSLVQWE